MFCVPVWVQPAGMRRWVCGAMAVSSQSRLRLCPASGESAASGRTLLNCTSMAQVRLEDFVHQPLAASPFPKLTGSMHLFVFPSACELLEGRDCYLIHL